jgi:hypothetical protein
MKVNVVLALVPICLGLTRAQAETAKEPGVDQLLDAIAAVESGSDAQAVGDKGRALGCYQIHRRYWQDGTRILGVDWSYDQARNPAKARQVVRAYLLHYGRGRSLIEKARIHNGGPRGYRKKATLKYARKIERALEQNAETS